MRRALGVFRPIQFWRLRLARTPFYVFFLFILGCTGLDSLQTSTAAGEYFQRGESFFEAGKYSEALKEYRTVTAQFPEDELAAAALYKTAYTELYFKNPAADPETSAKDFQRLIQRYPDSPWKGPAQNWINFLAQLELLKTEREKLKSDLQRLLDLDMQSERKRRDLK